MDGQVGFGDVAGASIRSIAVIFVPVIVNQGAGTSCSHSGHISPSLPDIEVTVRAPPM